jgi:hypothetical protein
VAHFIVHDEVAEGCDARNDGAFVIADPMNTSDEKVLLTTSDVDGPSVFLDVFERGDDVAIYTAVLAKASVISDTPIPWNKDAIGRNFGHWGKQVDVGAGVLKGGRNYEWVYRVPTVADGVLRGVFIWVVKAMEV